MAHKIEERDRQSGIEQAWHGLTNIVESVTQENSHPYEVKEFPVCYKVRKPNQHGFFEDLVIEDPEWKQLIATDDWLPVGNPYGASYHPSSITGFWDIIKQGMGDTPHQILSAGSVENRSKIFASIKLTDGFKIRDREFTDYITLLDSFDKSTSLWALYSNVCVVCSNTFNAAMSAGKTIGKAKHTAMLDVNVQRLIDAIDAFAGTSASFQQMLGRAVETPCARDEARAWITGLEGRNADRMTNGMLQKTARMMELFETGKGNEGNTRLDAFSAVTDFHSHESSSRLSKANQWHSSEFGSSAQTKTHMASRFEADWSANVRRGTMLLEKDQPVALAN